jgi:hypothetical protein
MELPDLQGEMTPKLAIMLVAAALVSGVLIYYLNFSAADLIAHPDSFLYPDIGTLIFLLVFVAMAYYIKTYGLAIPVDDTPPHGKKGTTTDKKDEDHKSHTTDEKEKNVKYGIDITMCPRPWLPEALNTVTFTARIYKCVDGEGWTYPGKPHKITFTLEEVSNEKGICLNKGQSKNKDLWFPKTGNEQFKLDKGEGPDDLCETTILEHSNPPHRHFQFAETKEEVTEATITVRSEDYGAFGFIHATAKPYVEIGPRADADAAVAGAGAACVSDDNKVKIPFDQDNNNIADVAAQNQTGMGLRGAERDVDATPNGDGTDGDGLTAYEEYRGFFVNEGGTPGQYKEKHIRTDINIKDVFVYIEEPRKLDKLDYFRRTGLAVHKITNKNLINGTDKREINFNRGYATGGLQHAIWLRDWSQMMKYGIACCPQTPATWEDDETPDTGWPGTPGTKTHVCVNVAKCKKKDSWGQEQPNDRLTQVIAHELGHAVNLPHHGEGGIHNHDHPGRKSPDRYYLLNTLSSGFMDCVMRYDRHANGWCSGPQERLSAHVKHTTYWNTARKRWNDKPGTHYCDTRTGDGENSNGGVTNDADKGRCANQIKVKDW